ncbi:hypothetical protein [Prevotella sp. OH937_COT-195]|uniref:hypothetical protein n=1 Tax=Prevotella sp. OH937_COT-195 TaxID=2491051 RepID=UPI000F64C190|nr:hypothetical protein [Prevotella sp. OH937_COT-195]RRC98743.1 hypothetical protein EII32_08700 [Prevotella sp. OH937_COT-195]
MKKIFTLLLILAAGTTVSFAQGIDNVLQFIDKNGNVIADGTTLTRNEVFDDGFEPPMIKAEISVKNTSAQEQGVCLKLNITKIEGGTVQACVGSCKTFDAEGNYNSDKDVVSAGSTMDLATEWILGDAAENAKCTVTYQLVRVESLGGFPPKFGNEYPGATITINYVNSKTPAGIDEISTDGDAKVVARYNANGQKTSRPVKGLNILKLSNGKTVKSINN